MASGDFREALITQLDTIPNVNVYSGAGGTIRTPAIWVAPGDPYLERIQQGSATAALYRVEVVIVAGRVDDRRAIAAIETTIDLVLPEIFNVQGAAWSRVTPPIPVQVAGVDYLAATVEVSGNR